MAVSGGKIWASDKDALKLPIHKRTYYLEAAGNRVRVQGWVIASVMPIPGIFFAFFFVIVVIGR